MINKCMDCGKEISKQAKRCFLCAMKLRKGINNFNYIDGKTLIKNFCPECGKKLGDYRSKRCMSCKQKGELNSQFKDLKIKYCDKCNKELSVSSKFTNSQTCLSCLMKDKWNKGILKIRFGEKAPGYIHGKGYEPYSLEFNEKLKESIRKRDNYTCQNCGMTEEEHLIVYDESLSIHHIDYNKQNCKKDNLITTCKQCNTRANSNRNYWKQFYLKKEKICDC